MRTFAEKPKATQQTTSAKSTKRGRAHFGQSREVNSILRLQRTIGNHAVQFLRQRNAEKFKGESTTTGSTRFGHDFSRIPVLAKPQTGPQPEMTVSTRGDKYEQEADRVADLVMGMHEPQLMQACVSGSGRSARQVVPLGQEDKHKLPQTKRVQEGGAMETTAPPVVYDVVHSPGQPLDSATRAYFEPRFGHDFSHVRVHTDSRASESAKAVNSLAYTVGRNIVVGAGQYIPCTAKGRQLLAHELTHVLQQGNSPRVMRKVRFEPESDKGASNEALAYFADIGLPASNYEFTSFEGGRATVEGRGSRPTPVSAEIGWAYLNSTDLYERKTGKMRRDQAEREALISNARTMGPALGWGKIVQGGGKVNPAYWEIVTGKGGVQMRTLENADPVAAIDDVKSNPGGYSVECYAGVAMIEMLTERLRLGPDQFRRRYPRLVVHFTTTGGVVTSLDLQGLTEWDVGSVDNIRELIPGDQSNWKSPTGFNENFIYLGGGQYFAHPAKIVSGKGDFASKVTAAGPAADLYMTQYRYRWLRWLPL